MTQLQYVKWPDHGIPDDPSDFISFVNHFRTTLNDSFGSCLVHCSAGVGRTGVTIAVDTCIALLTQSIPVNPLESVLDTFDFSKISQFVDGVLLEHRRGVQLIRTMKNVVKPSELA